MKVTIEYVDKGQTKTKVLEPEAMILTSTKNVADEHAHIESMALFDDAEKLTELAKNGRDILGIFIDGFIACASRMIAEDNELFRYMKLEKKIKNVIAKKVVTGDMGNKISGAIAEMLKDFFENMNEEEEDNGSTEPAHS